MTPPPSYDLFVSYADTDRTWVEGYLLDALTAAGVAYHSEDAFALGVPRLLEFERAIKQSKRTLLIISPAYLADTFTQFVDVLVNSYGLETATWPVIPFLLQPAELPPRLSQLTKLDATAAERWPAALERLCATLQRTPPPPPAPPACPYPGMAPFGESDSARFFGREREVQELLERLRLHRFLAVIGPSGSGKSSLVFAGLLPKLRASRLFGDGAWLIHTLRPGADPQAALSAAIGGDAADPLQAAAELLVAQPDARRLLLVVDQFEEAFTVAGAAAAPFQQTLLRLAETRDCYVLLTVRADFYADLMASALWREIQAHRVEVAPLDEQGLRQAVVQPAEAVGVFVETALVERLSADAAGEPGVLPLVQETLVLLWERLERRFLPLSAYELLAVPRSAYADDVGRTGLQVAMARRADAALADLAPNQQAIARRIFLRLIQFGEGRADTRRQQPVDKLRSTSDDLQMFEQTLNHLADSRLLTLSGMETKDEGRTTNDGTTPSSSVLRLSSSNVDIAHEALIGGWPKLQGWLNERRATEPIRRRLEEKADEWMRLGRGSGGLLDEVELAEAERWLASPDAADLGIDAGLQELVAASRAQIEAERRVARRRLRNTIAGLAVGLVLVTALAIWGGLTAQSAEARRVEAVTAQANAETRRVEAETAKAIAVVRGVEAQTAQANAEQEARGARRALAGQLAVQANAALDTHPQRSLLLAVEALHTTLRARDSRVPAAEEALRQALVEVGGRGLSGHPDDVSRVAISPDSHWLVTSSTGTTETTQLWNLAANDPAATSVALPGHTVAFSPDNHWLVTGSEDNTACLWDLTSENPTAACVPLPGYTDSATAGAFSPDSHWLVTRGDDRTARVWNLTAEDPTAMSIRLSQPEQGSFAISSDNHWLVTDYRETPRLWDLTAGNLAAVPIILSSQGSTVATVAISPDRHWLVTTNRDGSARLWDLAAENPADVPHILQGFEGYSPQNFGEFFFPIVAFTPDRLFMFIQSKASSHAAPNWNVRSWELTAPDLGSRSTLLLDQEAGVRDISLSSDNHWLVTYTYGGQFPRLWNLIATTTVSSTLPQAWEPAVFGPDNHWLVTGSDDNTARLWDLTAYDPAATPPILLHGHEGRITAAAFSPDSHWLVTGSDDNTARLWDLTAPASSVVHKLPGGCPRYRPTISLDTRRLAASGGPACVWDITNTTAVTQPLILDDDAGINTVAISPDSHWLATTIQVVPPGDNVHLWDLTVSQPVAIPLHGNVGRPNALVVSADNHWLVAGYGNGVLLWDLNTPDIDPQSLPGYTGSATVLAFSADSHRLITGSSDGAIQFWDLTARRPTLLRGWQAHKEAVTALAISADSHRLVTGSSGGTVRRWDLTTEPPAVLDTFLHTGAVAGVAMSADDHWLATRDDDTVRLWDLTDKDPSASAVALPSHAQPAQAIAFSPDNRRLITTDGQTIGTWPLSLDELQELACRTAGRNLTQEEWNQSIGRDTPYHRTCPNLTPGDGARPDATAATP